MPITPSGNFMPVSEIKSRVWATRLVFRPLLKAAKHDKAASNLPGMRAYFQKQIDQARDELARADELEKVLQ